MLIDSTVPLLLITHTFVLVSVLHAAFSSSLHLPRHRCVMSVRRPRSPMPFDHEPAIKRPHSLQRVSVPADLRTISQSMPRPLTTQASSASSLTQSSAGEDVVERSTAPQVGPGVDPDSEPCPDLSSHAQRPAWCRCGACELEDAAGQASVHRVKKEEDRDRLATQPERAQLCCLEVVAVERERVGGLVCKANAYTTTLREGPTRQQYSKFALRIKHAPPPSFSLCTAAQKRLVLYGLFHEMLRQAGGWQVGIAADMDRGKVQKTMPACITQAVRRQWPDPFK